MGKMKEEIIRDTLSFDLSKKALYEARTTGKTTVVCPKCGEVPKCYLNYTGPMLNRARVLCKCGYISNGEIYL